MTQFTKLAFMIALGLQSLGAMATSDQAATLTKGQFTSLVMSIPEDNVRDNVAMLYQDKKYDELESTLQEYITEYLENSPGALDMATIGDKKETVMMKIGNFIADKARESDKSQTESIEDMESSFEDTRDEIKIIQHAIEYLDENEKTEANNLLADEKYDDLQGLFLDDLGEESGIDLDELFHALDALNPAAADNFEDLPDEDEIEIDEKKELSDLKEILAATQDELKELLSRIDGA